MEMLTAFLVSFGICAGIMLALWSLKYMFVRSGLYHFIDRYFMEIVRCIFYGNLFLVFFCFVYTKLYGKNEIILNYVADGYFGGIALVSGFILFFCCILDGISKRDGWYYDEEAGEWLQDEEKASRYETTTKVTIRRKD